MLIEKSCFVLVRDISFYPSSEFGFCSNSNVWGVCVLHAVQFHYLIDYGWLCNVYDSWFWYECALSWEALQWSNISDVVFFNTVLLMDFPFFCCN